MDQEDRRRELELQILALKQARRATADPDAKAAISAQMTELRGAVDDINRLAAHELAAKVDGILRKLEEVRTRHGLDAVSALGRAIDGLRESRRDL